VPANPQNEARIAARVPSNERMKSETTEQPTDLEKAELTSLF